MYSPCLFWNHTVYTTFSFILSLNNLMLKINKYFSKSGNLDVPRSPSATGDYYSE